MVAAGRRYDQHRSGGNPGERLFEIALIWRNLNDRRYGRLIAAMLIGGCLGVTAQHVLGVPAARTPELYVRSFVIWMVPGLASGLIATIADFSAIFRARCSDHPRWQIRALPNLTIVLLAVIGFGLVVVACLAIAWWSAAVFGFSPFIRR